LAGGAASASESGEMLGGSGRQTRSAALSCRLHTVESDRRSQQLIGNKQAVSARRVRIHSMQSNNPSPSG